MKKILFLSALIPALFWCCKKDKPTVYAIREYPVNYILVIDDEDPVFIKYVQRVGNTILRSDIGRHDFHPNTLPASKECDWIVNLRGQVNGRSTFSFQLANDTGTYMMAVENRLASEYYIHPGSRVEGNKEWLFHIHDMKDRHGQRTIVLESAAYPGYFLSNQGPLGTGNGIRLLEGKPENAKQFLCY